MTLWEDDVTCKSQLSSENRIVSLVIHDDGREQNYSLPSRTNKSRLRVIGRVPRAAAELEPPLRVDGEVDLPETPGVVVLQQANSENTVE